MVDAIHPQQINGVWHLAAPQLERAFSLSLADTVDKHLQPLLDDQEQLWRIGESEAWAITRVALNKSGARVLQIVAIAGKGLNVWGNQFFEVVEAWAKAQGCTQSISTGRMGWRKRAPGYRPICMTYLKEL